MRWQPANIPATKIVALKRQLLRKRVCATRVDGGGGGGGGSGRWRGCRGCDSGCAVEGVSRGWRRWGVWRSSSRCARGRRSYRGGVIASESCSVALRGHDARRDGGGGGSSNSSCGDDGSGGDGGRGGSGEDSGERESLEESTMVRGSQRGPAHGRRQVNKGEGRTTRDLHDDLARLGSCFRWRQDAEGTRRQEAKYATDPEFKSKKEKGWREDDRTGDAPGLIEFMNDAMWRLST
ncbi:uncharacterized protein IWZ02DRAFT_157010 [Phyllosticta citriasiana]|uniref:uncharacterized protein n=1 Tax=Phyllosticta citriasiana TaxID=595635 RepID=UPI0030FD3BE6